MDPIAVTASIIKQTTEQISITDIYKSVTTILYFIIHLSA